MEERPRRQSGQSSISGSLNANLVNSLITKPLDAHLYMVIVLFHRIVDKPLNFYIYKAFSTVPEHIVST